MTILKKLTLIIILLALGMQFNAHAFCNDTNDHIKNEKALILNFAQDLRQKNNAQAQAIAQWLDQQVIDESFGSYDSTIIDVITDKNLTETTKLTLFSEMMAQQKAHRIKRFISDVCQGIMIIGCCGTLLWILNESEKRRDAFIDTNPRSKVTIKYRTAYSPPLWYVLSALDND